MKRKKSILGIYCGMISLLLILSSFSHSGTLPPVYTVEPGIRIDNASNPKAGYNNDSTVGEIGTYLYYQDNGNDSGAPPAEGFTNETFAVSSDGLNFESPQHVEITEGLCSNDSLGKKYIGNNERLKLPDGSGWRMYFLKQIGGKFDSFSSMFSSDGINFCDDTGNRYELGPTDNDSMGVYTTFATGLSGGGQVVLLYLGDLSGKNNARRALAGGDGLQFVWDRDNVLGDQDEPLASQKYVDISTVPLDVPGKRRLYTMKGGDTIYSFITEDDGETFELEEGYRVTARDFDVALDFDGHVCNLYDPSILQYRDGDNKVLYTRMYVNGSIWDNTATWTNGLDSGKCSEIEACGPKDRYEGCYTRSAIFSAISVNIDSKVIPDIKANNLDGPILVPSNSPVHITVQLNSGDYAGQNADWWVYAVSSIGTFSWVFPKGWQRGEHSTAEYPLFNFPTYTVYSQTLPIGTYTFYFSVDNNADGLKDETWNDSVTVTVQ